MMVVLRVFSLVGLLCHFVKTEWPMERNGFVRLIIDLGWYERNKII